MPSSRVIPPLPRGADPRSPRRDRRAAGAVAALASLGFLDAVYMLAFTEGVLERIACPFFGDGCAKVGRSPDGRTLGVPHAAVGILGYAVMAVLALWRPDRTGGTRWTRTALVTTATGAASASAYLTWEQAARVRAWCFWCLGAALVNIAILALSLVGWSSRGER